MRSSTLRQAATSPAIALFVALTSLACGAREPAEAVSRDHATRTPLATPQEPPVRPKPPSKPRFKPLPRPTAVTPQSERSRGAIARVRPRLEKELAARRLQYGAPVFIRILKEEYQLELWIEAGDRFELFRSYRICTWSGELGPKLAEGDGQSPEGFYYVSPHRMNPASSYHLAFNLGYPNAYDRAHRRTGSALMVHGDCASIGCYAMTDERIEEIYALVDAALCHGQPYFRVHVFPFHMTDDNLARHAGSRWEAFWQNLKEGYDFFERTGRPPNVEVHARRYVFEEAN